MKKSVFCIAYGEGHAQDIITSLHHAGFSEAQISMLCADKNKEREEIGFKKNTNASQGAAAGAAAGGIIGGALGLLAGLGTITIPGIGLFLVGGPILATLSGLAAGGSVGYLAGALIGLGIPKYIVTLYEGKLQQGHVLIVVHPESEEELHTAKSIFKKAGGQDISTTGDLSREDISFEGNKKECASASIGRDEVTGIIAQEVHQGIQLMQHEIAQMKEEILSSFSQKHKEGKESLESINEEIQKGVCHLQEALNKGIPEDPIGIQEGVHKGVEKAREFVTRDLPQAPVKAASALKKGTEKVREFFKKEEKDPVQKKNS